jgi:putative endonuclease
MTTNLARRAFEHRTGAVPGFTRQYGVDRLVYVEFPDTVADAALREKQMKRWKRAWKLALIERDNPQWRDLYDDIPM